MEKIFLLNFLYKSFFSSCEAFIHTLLNDCFSGNVGDWKHGIKDVTKGDRDRQTMVVKDTFDPESVYLTNSCRL